MKVSVTDDFSADAGEALWRLLDSYRGLSLDRLEFTALTAAVLLLRWLEREDGEREAVAAFDDFPFESLIPESVRWEKWLRGPMDGVSRFLDEQLIPWLEAGSNGHRLHRLVPALELHRRVPAAALRRLISFVDTIPADGPRSRLTASYVLESALELAFKERKRRVHHEVFTPPGVIDLIVDLASPEPGERIYDPCFGVGGLLAACARRLASTERFSPSEWERVRRQSIFGVELQPLQYVIGLARVVLAGIAEPGLELGDALDRPAIGLPATERFDLVVANPPLGGRRSESVDQFRFRTTALESLFLQHAVDSLRPGGRAVFVAPEGLLFRGGPERALRQWLLDELRVEGVIALPSDAFWPYSSVKTNIVVLRRTSPNASVRFVNVAHLAGTFGRARADSELPRSIAERFRAGEPGSDLWDVPRAVLLERNADLVARRPADDELENALDQLRSSDACIAIRNLVDVADVRSGWSYSRGDVSERAISGAARLVRVSDLTDDGSIRPPTLGVNVIARLPEDERYTLAPGDVLISASGTVAKVATVPVSNEKLIASKSVFLVKPLLKEPLSGAFLAALLRSESYARWMLGRASGSTIAHLPLSTLRRVPVPIPELGVQESVVRIWQREGGDALRVLIRVLTGAALDPISRWLDTDDDVRLLLSTPSGATEDLLPAIECLADSCWSLRNSIVHAPPATRMPPPHLEAWLLAFANVLRPVRGVTRVPAGPNRYAILEPARLGLANCMVHLKDDDLDLSNTARELTRRIEHALTGASDSLLQQATFDAELVNDRIPVDEAREVIVRLRCLTTLPLRQARFRSVPAIGKASAEFVTDQQVVPLTLNIPAMPHEGKVGFVIKWSAERLDGQQIGAELPIEIEIVRKDKMQSDDFDLGASPYITGTPVKLSRSDMFFGREDILDRMRMQFPPDRSGNAVILEGNKRMGKTSILERLRAPNALPGWIVAYCTLQGGAGSLRGVGLEDRQFFRLLVRCIGEDLAAQGVRTWLPGVPTDASNQPFRLALSEAAREYFRTDDPVEAFDLYLHEAISACRAKGARLLLLLDEFDKLQEGIESGVTSPQVPGNLRALLHRHADDMSAVLCGAVPLGQAQRDYWSVLYGFGYRIGVGSLSREAAMDLVTRPVENRLHYMDDARDRVIDLCGGHPFLIQTLCNRIFEDAFAARQRTVTLAGVQRAANKLVREKNLHFDTLWSELRTDRRRLLLALCDRLSLESADGEIPQPVTLRVLESELERRGVEVEETDGLAVDLEFLQRLEILTYADNQYSFTTPLVARWIHEKDLSDLERRAQREAEEAKG